MKCNCITTIDWLISWPQSSTVLDSLPKACCLGNSATGAWRCSPSGSIWGQFFLLYFHWLTPSAEIRRGRQGGGKGGGAGPVDPPGQARRPAHGGRHQHVGRHPRLPRAERGLDVREERLETSGMKAEARWTQWNPVKLVRVHIWCICDRPRRPTADQCLVRRRRADLHAHGHRGFGCQKLRPLRD